MNDKVDIEIFQRRLTVEIEGLTPLQINTLAKQVSEKMEDIANQNNKIADSSKLAILTALDFAAELNKALDNNETSRRVLENKLEHMTLALKEALEVSSLR